MKKIFLAAFVFAFGASAFSSVSAYFDDFTDLQTKTYTRVMMTQRVNAPENTMKDYFFHWNSDEDAQYNELYRDHLLARLEAIKPRIQWSDYGMKRQVSYLEQQLKKSAELEVLLQYAENEIVALENRYIGSPREQRVAQHYNPSRYYPLMKITRPELLSKPQQQYYLGVE
jgi:hypothetical protein